jgi:hypothetical protein
MTATTITKSTSNGIVMRNQPNTASITKEEVQTVPQPQHEQYYASSAQWKKQLMTKEDPNHIHKTFGILVLMSYIYRLVQCGMSTASDMGFVTQPQLTLPTVALHFMLNATSFIFKIPAKRIATGYRIWPEYRLHSLVFLCRNLACILLFYIERTYYKGHQFHILNLLIVLGTMAAADISSYTQGPQHTSGFARELDVPAYMRYFFSMAQLGATAMILHGQRRCTMHFMMIIIIQGNAFLMTIRRKNLASHTVLTSIYGLALFGTGLMAHYEYALANINVRRAIALLGYTATVLRTGPRILPILSIVQNNKYILWTTLFVLHELYIRPYLEEEMSTTRVMLNIVPLIAAIALGFYKHYKEQQSKSNEKVIKSV